MMMMMMMVRHRSLVLEACKDAACLSGTTNSEYYLDMKPKFFIRTDKIRQLINIASLTRPLVDVRDAWTLLDSTLASKVNYTVFDTSYLIPRI